MAEKTLVMIKPDAVVRGLIGEVINRFEKENLKVVGLRMLQLNQKEAEGFYIVHKERPFYSSLTAFMSSQPIVVIVLEGEKAIERVRAIMGATDPSKAAPGTIRRDLAQNIEQNSVHGSDSPESAAFEVPYFFSQMDLSAYTRIK
jgi:nucleoside-diphosphate kinase